MKEFLNLVWSVKTEGGGSTAVSSCRYEHVIIDIPSPGLHSLGYICHSSLIILHPLGMWLVSANDPHLGSPEPYLSTNTKVLNVKET